MRAIERANTFLCLFSSHYYSQITCVPPFGCVNSKYGTWICRYQPLHMQMQTVNNNKKKYPFNEYFMLWLFVCVPVFISKPIATFFIFRQKIDTNRMAQHEKNWKKVQCSTENKFFMFAVVQTWPFKSNKIDQIYLWIKHFVSFSSWNLFVKL